MNKHRHCVNLDACLSGELCSDELAQFEAHLDACADCREAVDQQRWLDGLLQSPARSDLEPLPAALVDSFRHEVARCRTRRRLATGGLAIAATVLVAVGWTLWSGLRSDDTLLRQAVRSDDGDVPTQPPSGQLTQAVVVGDESTIVVPVESRYPNVTVVRVYRTYRPTKSALPNVEFFYPDDDVDIPGIPNGG